MMWFIEDTGRLGREQAGLLELERESDWMAIEGTRLDESVRLCYDIEIRLDGRAYPVTLVYPASFPFSPPSVTPRSSERWSGHQYGNGGELCLEWGPDNWLSSITGRDMIASAYRLLRSESPRTDGASQLAPSRHALSVGQELRNRDLRFLQTRAMTIALGAVTAPAMLRMSFISHAPGTRFVIVPVEVRPGEPDAWIDRTVSSSLCVSDVRVEGWVAILPIGAPMPASRTVSAFREELAKMGCAYPADSQPGPLDLLLVWRQGDADLVWLSEAEDRVIKFAQMKEGAGGRSHANRSLLKTKTVAIVGCGSLGSKVAVSLARSGVCNFVLVDDDVMLPENLVRHELDWSAMGDQKVDALARRIALVSPTAECGSFRHQVGGQESNGGLAIVLSRLSKCDLVVDATASAHVFNLLGAVVDRAGKPLVWAEVFPGGIGGLVARSRPGLDPSPQTARARLAAWCDEKGIAAPLPVAPYEAVSGDIIQVADDADVAVMAAHVTRFVIDLLVGHAESIFPYSAYFIGLEAGWIFAEPFHTFPVDLGVAEEREAELPDPAALDMLQRLIREYRDRPSAA